jgi:sensor histidine kinase regulating citrate/malate metabolism
MIKDEIKKLRSMTDLLIEANMVLLEHDDYLEIALKSIPELILIVDIEYKVIFVNNALKNKLKGDENILVVQSYYDIITKEMEFNESKGDGKEPVFFKCFDGWYSYSFSPIKEGNVVVGYTCLFKNEDNNVEMRKELVRVNGELTRIKEKHSYLSA